MVLIDSLRSFFKLIKFEHSLFALPFAYLGLFIAEDGFPDLRIFFWVTIAMVSLRTSAMCFNRLIDEKIDYENPRTKDRLKWIAAISKGKVFQIAIVCIAIFIFSAFQLNTICFFLSPLPVFLIWIYPYLKRITWSSHFVLGIILGIAPMGGWLASRPEWSLEPVLLVLAVWMWVSGFDLIYALQDVEFDRAHELKSFPVRFGIDKTIWFARNLHIGTLLILVIFGIVSFFGIWYWIGMSTISVLIAREHYLVKKFGLLKINEAFFNMNVFVSVIIFFATMIEGMR